MNWKSDRDRRIVVRYLENYSLREVGAQFGISYERVRQILALHGLTGRIRTDKPVIPTPPKRALTLTERFWSQVQTAGASECWEFVGCRYPNGYGRFATLGKTWYAHRLAYLLTHRKVPLNWVLHHCDNPSCVNPAHLYDGTPKENTADRDRRKRSAYLADPEGWHRKLLQGQENHRQKYGAASKVCKLTVEQVRSIKHRLRDGEPYQLMAPEYGVKPSTIQAIKYGVNWKHVVVEDTPKIFSS
jgi:hypothetical protein